MRSGIVRNLIFAYHAKDFDIIDFDIVLQICIELIFLRFFRIDG